MRHRMTGGFRSSRREYSPELLCRDRRALTYLYLACRVR